jgi:hypothetical protein
VELWRAFRRCPEASGYGRRPWWVWGFEWWASSVL